MTEIVFAIPIMHGREDLDRQTRDEMAGARRDAYEAALKDAVLEKGLRLWLPRRLPVGLF